MEPNEYKNIFSLEDTYWWYVGLRELVHDFLRPRLGRKGAAVLDAGCGTGALLKELSSYAGAYGIDSSEIALGFSRKRGLRRLANASVSSLPFREESFDSIISLDVLYHRGVRDDVAALKEFRRALKKGGVLILNLPAYESLRSSHDEAVHTRERYTAAGLEKKLLAAGFAIEKITYRNFFLFPPVLLIKLAKASRPGGHPAEGTHLKPLPGPLNSLLVALLRLENQLIRFVRLPFGTSVFCVARK